jgi:hypothetical protein
MRGLPIGAFYLLEGRSKQTSMLVRLREPKGSGDSPQLHSTVRASFALLDGQQRMRAILAGIGGPAEGKVCLWVDLGSEDAKQAPSIRL